MEFKDLASLFNYLRDQRSKYYNGEAEISDQAFDAIEEKAYALDPTNPYFQEVGATPAINQIQHKYPMRSTKKIKTPEKMTNWLIKRMGNDIQVVVEPKIDGVSATCAYEHKQLKYVATRGDGFVGKDISRFAEFIDDIPKTIPLSDAFEIRGELYLPRNTQYAQEKGEQKSLRNIAAGIINRKDGSEDAKYLKFVSYIVLGLPLENELEKLEFLQATTPNPIPYEIAHSPEEVASIWEEYKESKREVLPFEVDGLVVKMIYNQEQFIGTNPHHLDYEVAWKFPPERKETILNDVVWQTGEKGKLTPVAIFEPVLIQGRTITKATLHNQKRIEDLQLEIGDIIEIALMGDVIPGVISNLSKNINLGQ